jgi:hypothetical protein
MDQAGAVAIANPGEQFRGFGINAKGLFPFRFAQIHIRHGGAVDHYVRFNGFNPASDSIEVVQVCFGPGKTLHFARIAKLAHECRTQTAAGSDNQNTLGGIIRHRRRL